MTEYAERMERVQREEMEWAAARRHEALHHNWLAPDECATCIAESAAFDDEPEPIDLNREGDPTLNGAW